MPETASSSSPRMGIARGTIHVGLIWCGFLITALICALIFSSAYWLIVAATVMVSVAFAYAFLEILLAKARVLQGQDVQVWKGFAKLVSWNPTEGVVFLKNKRIDLVDDNPNDGGGIRVVYPFFGEELVLRVPLEIQTLSFRDHEVLTKEYMPLSIQGTIYWRVMDLNRFYLSIGKEVHLADDEGRHGVERTAGRPQLEVAEQWLRAMAEEKTRTIVSRIGTGLLISDQLASELPRALPGAGFDGSLGPESSQGYRTATDGLAAAIKSEFGQGIQEYGLEIHRVALQEVKLPPEIYAAAVDACKSAYLPLKAKAEALEQKMKLQAVSDVIGKDAAGLKEIAGNIPALAFQEFLAPLFLDFNRKRAIANSPADR